MVQPDDELVYVRFNPRLQNKVIAQCIKDISKQTYYLHNKTGGEGWQLIINNGITGPVLRTDKFNATMILLKIGHE